MTAASRVLALVEPLLVPLHLEVYDLEMGGDHVRLTIDKPSVPRGPDGGSGVGMDDIAAATRAVSRALDAEFGADERTFAGPYTLEVSSPGLERALRTPAHFARAVGALVNVKTRPGTDGERRLKGLLVAADDTALTIDVQGGDGERVVRIDDVERARTVFEWGATPKPGAPAGKQR